MTNNQAHELLKLYQSKIESYDEAIKALKNNQAKWVELHCEIMDAVSVEMQSSGIIEDEFFKLATTTTVDADIDAVPEEYIRIKREVNKDKIRKEAPKDANWYTIKETKQLKVK